MPKPKSPPKLQLNESGYYEVRWFEGGVTKRRSLFTKDETEGKAAFASFLLSSTPQSQYTVVQAKELRLSETSPVAKDRLEYAWKALLPFFGTRDVTSITPTDVKAYTALRTSGKKPVKPPTVRRELGELQTTINHLVKTKRLPSTAAPLIELPPAGKPKTLILTSEQRSKVLELAAKRRDDPLVPSRVELFCYLGLETGARKEAIETLEWSQVDFDTRFVHYLKEGAAQTRKRRVSVPMSPTLVAVLSAEKQRASTPYVLRQPESIRTAFASLMAAAGLPQVTPHVLRHTFVSHLLMKGKDVFTVAQLAGMTVKMVEEVYGHLTQQHLHAALAA